MASQMGKLFLNKEVTLQDLNKGIEFEVQYDEQYTDSEDETYFDDESFQTFKEDVAPELYDEKPILLNFADISFAELKEGMEPITQDRKIFKQIIKHGVEETISDKSVALMHYEAYLEYKREPFDSTRLRKSPYKFLLGEGDLLLGLELGIKTMKKSEVSRFLISPDYAFGPLGCPPRIPPSSEILFEVELINFYRCKDVIEFEDMTPEEQKKAPFEKIVSVYQCEHQFANDLFHKKLYKPAISRYRKAVKLLENVFIANEEEEEKQKCCLLKLYLNLSQCFINIENPCKALIYAKLALRIDGHNPKALYRLGYAYYLMKEFERAEHYLIKARKFQPYDQVIAETIVKVENERKLHLDWEKQFCKLMLGNDDDNLEKDRALRETPEFISVIEEEIQEFVNSKKKEKYFSPGYTEDQLEVVKKVADKFNLAFVSKIVDDLKINKVVKRK